MKKLIIAAAIAFSGVVAHAAIVNWKVDYIDGIDEAPMTGYYGFLVVNTVTGAGAGGYTGPSYGVALARAALEDGDASFVSTYALQDVSGNIATAFAEYTAASGALGYISGVDVMQNNTTVNAYLVILDNADPTQATTAFLLDKGYLSNGSSYDSTTEINGSGNSDPINFGQAWNATEEAGDWYTVGAAPEPTSGLLLLIGIAGLALKRKRA